MFNLCVTNLRSGGIYFQILMFDSLRGRTCLHYAAYYGHPDCLKLILSTARTSHVALSWYVFNFPDLNLIPLSQYLVKISQGAWLKLGVIIAMGWFSGDLLDL